MSYPVFAIFAVCGSYQIGRVAGAHCLYHDKIIRGPFATFQDAKAAFEAILAERRGHNAS